MSIVRETTHLVQNSLQVKNKESSPRDLMEVLNLVPCIQFEHIRFSSETLNFLLTVLSRPDFFNSKDILRLFKQTSEYHLEELDSIITSKINSSELLRLELIYEVLNPAIKDLDGNLSLSRTKPDNSSLTFKLNFRHNHKFYESQYLTSKELLEKYKSIWLHYIPNYLETCFSRSTSRSLYTALFLSDKYCIVLPEEYILL